MKTKLIILTVSLLVTGCAQELTPRQRLDVTYDVFNNTMDTLNILNEAGKFDSEQQAKIIPLLDTGEMLMLKWKDAVIAGEAPPDIIDNALIIIGQLLEYKLKGQSNE